MTQTIELLAYKMINMFGTQVRYILGYDGIDASIDQWKKEGYISIELESSRPLVLDDNLYVDWVNVFLYILAKYPASCLTGETIHHVTRYLRERYFSEEMKQDAIHL
jgi:hypothetical protein